MHNFLEFTASYVLNAVWEGALIFLAACVASRILRRLGPQAEHVVWIASLIAAVVSPALPILRQAESLVPRSSTAGSAAAMLVADQGVVRARTGVLSIPQDWLWILAALYFASAFFFAGRLLLSLGRAVRLFRQASPALLDEEQEEIWSRCGETFSLRGARIMTSADVPGPMALDLGGPILLIPADFGARCSPVEFLAALAHECAHLRRRDFQKNLFYEVASLALAFHPLVWAIKSHIAQTREMICDGIATAHVDSLSYARSLLRLAEMVAVRWPISTIHAIGIFDAGILEKRIMRIRMKKDYPGAIARWC